MRLVSLYDVVGENLVSVRRTTEILAFVVSRGLGTLSPETMRLAI